MIRNGLLFLGIVVSFWVSAMDDFRVQSIHIEGLQRISTGTVLTYLPVNVGDIFNRDLSINSIKALYKTGFFKDIRLQKQGRILIVTVVERSAIADIVIDGNKAIETEQLLSVLKDIGLAKGRAYNRVLLDRIEQELERQYFSQGKYAVQIKSRLKDLPRNRKKISITIKEGEAAKIKKINIVGNQAFNDKKLLNEFTLAPSGLLSFISSNDQYSRQKLSAELERLRSYYLDRGYINFKIDSTQVSISEDKKDVFITINITEGEIFTVNQVKLAGNLVLDKATLFKLVTLNPGDIFSRKKITRTSARIGRELGNEGYAFANINTIPDIEQESKQVSITFFVDPGRRVYVNRINLKGNTRTSDEVIRREIRQMEKGWISTAKVELSRARINRLGFFEEVTVETPAVPGTHDQVDVNYRIEEKPSGNVLAGLGYSQTQGVILNASIKENNFLGSGKRVNFAFNNSEVNTVYSFGYLNPYYTLDGISRGFNLFFRETDAAAANLSDYTTDSYGLSTNYGIPLNEFDRLRFELGFENLRLQSTRTSPLEVDDFIARHGDDYDAFKLGISWSHDSRNRAIFATRGTSRSASVEVTIPGSDLEFFKFSYKQTLLFPLTQSLTFSWSSDIAYGDGYGDLEVLPFFRNYFAGGVRSLRGYDDNSLGPKDSNNNPIGGALRIISSYELIFPVPFMENQKTFRLSAFFDAGNVFRSADDLNLDDFRYSAGLSAIWLSPLGALRFSLAQPINDQAGDDTQVFQFALGSVF